jgi:hypothetical protein
MRTSIDDQTEVELRGLATASDRVVAELQLGDLRLFQTFFVRDGRIVELVGYADEQEASVSPPSPPPPSPPSDARARLGGLAAVFPVRDLEAALAHYRQLGFEVSAYEGGGYGYARRDDVQLHFSEDGRHEPRRSAAVVYLYVDDADALYAQWRSSGVSGQFHEPVDTEYGLREGAHVDRDGNLLRFGSALTR